MGIKSCTVFSLFVTISILLIFPALVRGISFGLSASVTINPVYDLSLDIEILNKRVSTGENLRVYVELEKTGREGEIAVDLNYEIRKKRKIAASGYLGSINVSNYKDGTFQIEIPGDMKPGKYTLNVTATHPQARSDSDSGLFWARRKRFFSFFDIFNWTFIYDYF